MLPPEPRIWYEMYLIIYGNTVQIIMIRILANGGQTVGERSDDRGEVRIVLVIII